MTPIARWMAAVVCAVCLFSTTLAFALPTPKDIEAAVVAGHYTQAETMLREVIQEKPQSAKAHYELGQVLAHEQRYKDAQTELLKAKALDPSLKFAASPDKFNSVLAKVNDLAAAPTSSVVMEPSVKPSTPATPTAAKAPQEAVTTGGASLTYVWIAIAGLVVMGLWLRRSAAAHANTTPSASMASMPMPSTPVGTPAAPRGFGAQFTPHAPQGAYPPSGYAPPSSGGSTMTGAVVGGLAGVAAGYALSKAMEGDHNAPAASHASPTASNNSGYVPFDAPVAPDLGTFDAGSGSDWDSADAGGSDDSW